MSMNSVSVARIERPGFRWQALSRSLRGGLKGGEYTWAVAFVVPYLAVFVTFVAYPVVYGLWLGSDPSLYPQLFSDPVYQDTVVNTVLYLALGVNVKMFLALLLSGFFMRPGWWMKVLLLIFILPWAVPQISAFISIHWMIERREEQAQRLSSLSYDEILRTKVAFGTGPGLIDRLRQLREELGLTGIAAELNPGGLLPFRQEMRSLEVLTHQVTPAFK